MAASSGASPAGPPPWPVSGPPVEAADPSSGTGYHPMDPGIPLNGPTTQLVTQPP